MNAAQERPTEDWDGRELKAEFDALSLKETVAHEISWEPPKHEAAFVALYLDKFTVTQIINGPNKYYVSCNYGDPDNPVSAEEMATNLAEAYIEEAKRRKLGKVTLPEISKRKPCKRKRKSRRSVQPQS